MHDGAQIPTQIDASTQGAMTCQAIAGPDGKMGLLIVLKVPGSQTAIFVEHDRVRGFREVFSQAANTAAAGLVVPPTPMNGLPS